MGKKKSKKSVKVVTPPEDCSSQGSFTAKVPPLSPKSSSEKLKPSKKFIYEQAVSITPRASYSSASYELDSDDDISDMQPTPRDVRRRVQTTKNGKPAPRPPTGEPCFAIVFASHKFKDEIPKLDDRLLKNYKSLFRSQICYLDQDTVSLRLTVVKPESFYHHEAVKHNRVALFSADLPFSSTDPSKLSSSEKLLLVEHVIKRIVYDECHVPLNAEIFITPFHDLRQKSNVWEQCGGWWFFSKINGFNILSVPLGTIRRYYGDSVMFYFAWMGYYQKWLLCGPAFVGLALFLINYSMGLNNDTNPLVPFFSIFVMLWAIFFVKMWERQEHHLSVEFNLNHAESEGEVRKKYWGHVRPSPVTGKPEIHYAGWKRALKQPVSWLITFIFLGFSLFVQVCSLNLQGYMNSKQHERFEIDFFDQFSREGRIFDPEGDYAMVPVVLHSVAVLFLNGLYQRLADFLTEWENYRLRSEHEVALTQKRVFFEFIDCFVALFYVAFYRLDLQLLRQELISLFAVDQFRRLLLESIIPFLWGYGKRKVAERKLKLLKHKMESSRIDLSQSESTALLSTEEELDTEYDSFDDYLEMVMQFGYITFFAAAFPLAAFLSLVGNAIEMRSDLFKLSFVLRRPIPERTKSIKPWGTVLKIFAVMCVISNTLLFAFTSNQMRLFFPQLFNPDGTIETASGRFVVATAFALEHVLLGVVLFILWKIPSVPTKVSTELQRRKYVRMLNQQSSEGVKGHH